MNSKTPSKTTDINIETKRNGEKTNKLLIQKYIFLNVYKKCMNKSYIRSKY